MILLMCQLLVVCCLLLFALTSFVESVITDCDSTDGLLRRLASDVQPFHLTDYKSHLKALLSIAEGGETLDCLNKVIATNKKLQTSSSRKIYLDLGCRMLDSSIAFAKMYPEGDQYDIYCFEANPKFAPFYAKQAKNYPRVTFVNKAVGVAKDELFLTDQQTGSSIAKPEDVGKAAGGTMVPVINFAEFLVKANEGGIKFGDRVVMKIDIEGMEYALLHHLARSGVLGLVTDLLVEFHASSSTSDGVRYKDCYALIKNMRLALDDKVEFIMWNNKNTIHRSNPHYMDTHGGFYPVMG